MRKQIILGLLLLVIGYKSIAQKADDILGIFYSPDKRGKIEVYKQQGKYFGKTICCDTSRKDSYNPDPALRSRSRIGVVFLLDFEYLGDGNYENGRIYNLDDGRTYSGMLWLEGNLLKVRGYMGSSLLGKTVTFERVE